MYETSINEFSGAVKLKLPSKSEIVPFEVPLTTTEAPIIGILCESSTLPVTVIFLSDTDDFVFCNHNHLSCICQVRLLSSTFDKTSSIEASVNFADTFLSTFTSSVL